MKGIILAGGKGSRLYPLTLVVSKQLLPVYNKPMIYYPISILMLSGIKEILIISTPEDLPQYKQLLGNGDKFGLSFSYIEQPKPEGLAQAFILGESFIGNDDVCLILGDNILYGHGLSGLLSKCRNIVEKERKSVVFGYYVRDPERYGVAEVDKDLNVISLEEKPLTPKSNNAVIGLYYYTNDVIQLAKEVQPSERGELEITSVNQAFLDKKALKLTLLGRGFAWLDTGTHDSLREASSFIQTVEKRQGLKVACLEEIAYSKGYISKKEVLLAAEKQQNEYGDYLKELIQ
jgi:glucose-1-phosphate thymidylyltransferase